MHHGTCITHVPWCMPGSLPSGFIWSRWRGIRSRHSRSTRNTQFCVSGKRSISYNVYLFSCSVMGWHKTILSNVYIVHRISPVFHRNHLLLVINKQVKISLFMRESTEWLPMINPYMHKNNCQVICRCSSNYTITLFLPSFIGSRQFMITSSNGNILRVTVLSCGEFTGLQWIPIQFPSKRPVTRCFDVFFDLLLNKRLSKQSRGWWFDTLSRSLWHHCNVYITFLTRRRISKRPTKPHKISQHF